MPRHGRRPFLGLFLALVAAGCRSTSQDPPGSSPARAEGRVAEVLADVAAGVYHGSHEDPHPLRWEDIPALLALSDRTDRIARPVNANLAMLPPREESQLELGSIALYLVEGIRRNEKFPTLTILHGKPSDEDLPRRAAAYWGWWDSAQKTSRAAARALDPLHGTGLSWQ
jgi:hypothetical protein